MSDFWESRRVARAYYVALNYDKSWVVPPGDYHNWRKGKRKPRSFDQPLPTTWDGTLFDRLPKTGVLRKVEGGIPARDVLEATEYLFASSEKGGVGPVAARSAAPAPAALPCLRINNSTVTKLKAYKFKDTAYPLLVEETVMGIFNEGQHDEYEQEIPTGYMLELRTDIYGAKWTEDDAGYQKRISAASSRDRKTSFALIENLKDFIARYGREHCAFWTITAPDECHPKEFARRWNSFLAHHGGFIVDYGRVLEPQENGRPHYHFVVAVRWNMKPDEFDWQASRDAAAVFKREGRTPYQRGLTARYSASAAEQTRKKWSYLRKVLPRFKLGRSEFLPIRSVAEAIAKYVGHYLDAGLKLRKDEWKGCRRVEWSRRTKTRRLQVNGFAFANFTENKKTGIRGTGGPGRIWRLRCAALLAAVGGTAEDDVAIALGKKWRYRYRTQLTADEVSFQEWLREDVPHLIRNYAHIPFQSARHRDPERPGVGAARAPTTARPETPRKH